MKKIISSILLIVLLLNTTSTMTVSIANIYKFKASQIIDVEDIHELDWSQLEVGDQLNISKQTINNFDDYTYLNYEWNEVAQYNPETNSYILDSQVLNGLEPSIQPKYSLDLSQEVYFGASFDADSDRDFFGLNGYIQMITRPEYLYTHAENQWSNAGSNENSWYASVDHAMLSTVTMKYKEEGRFIRATQVPYNSDWNTQTVHIDPQTGYSEFMLCTLPETNASFNCADDSATNVVSYSVSISSKYLNNKYVSIRINPGKASENSKIELFGLQTEAYIESFGELTTTNKEIYVPLGTSAEQAHDIADPKYSEFVNSVVTAVDRDVPFSDLLTDGGYDPNTEGTYKFTYQVEKDLDGGITDFETVAINVVDPNQISSISGDTVTYPLSSAPTTKAQLAAMQNISAYDPNNQTDITNKVSISNYGGYDMTKPQVGEYEITYYVTGSDNRTVYKSATLRLIADSNVQNLSAKQSIVSDEDGDNKISAGETVTVELNITNTTKVNLDVPTFTYTVNENILDTSTITTINSSANDSINGNQITLSKAHLYPNETLTYKYQVTANESFKIESKDQDLLTLENSLSTSSIGYNNQNTILNSELADSAYRDFNFQMTVKDADIDQLISTNEELEVSLNFTNDSAYLLTNAQFKLEELNQKVNLKTATYQVSSDSRTLTSSDYVVSDNTLTMNNVMPGEKLTVTVIAKTNTVFTNLKDANIQASISIYVDNSNVLYDKLNSSKQIAVDTDSIAGLETAVRQVGDKEIAANEQFEIEFEFKNTGSFVYDYVSADLDLTDVNLKDVSLDQSTVDISLFSGTEQINLDTSNVVISGNKITYKNLKPGETVIGKIILNSTDTLYTSHFEADATSSDINIPIQLSNSYSDVVNDNISIGLDLIRDASYVSSITKSETSGDGDNLIDPNEQFTYVINLKNNGTVQLANLDLELFLNSNDGAIISNSEIIVTKDGEAYSDYTIADNKLHFSSLLPKDNLNITIKVTYGPQIKANTSANSYLITQALIADQQFPFNQKIDLANNQNISLVVGSSKSQLAAGETTKISVNVKNNGSSIEKNLILNLRKLNQNFDVSSISNITVNGQTNKSFVITKDTITLDALNPGEETVITFDIDVKDTLTIDPVQGENFVFDLTVGLILSNQVETEYSLEIDPIITSPQYTTTLSATPFMGSDVIKTSDTILYTYTLTNGSNLNLTNNTVSFKSIDPNLGTIENFEISSNDPSFEYQINSQDKTISFTNLGAENQVVIKIYAKTTSTFDSTPTIDASFDFSSDFTSKSDQVSITKDLLSEATINSNVRLLSTSSGNMLLGPDENIVYQLAIENDGKIDLANLKIDTNIEDRVNLISQTIVEIVDENGTQLSPTDYSYDQETSSLVINSLKVGTSIYINYNISTAPTIEYFDSIPVVNTISYSAKSTQKTLNLFIDTENFSTLAIDYSFDNDPVYNDADGKVDPGEHAVLNIKLTATDAIDINDVYVVNLLDDPNATADFSGIQVLNSQGIALAEGTDYEYVGSELHLFKVPGNDFVTISIPMIVNSTLSAADIVTFEAAIRSDYPVFGEHTTPISISLPIDIKSNLDYTLDIVQMNANASGTVAPGDTVDFTLTVKNTGLIDIENLEITSVLDSNIDPTTVSLDLLSSLNAHFEGSHLIIDQVEVGEEIVITGSSKANSTFNSNTQLNLTVNSDYQSLIRTDTSSIPIDKSGAGLSYEYNLVEVQGDGDGLIDPGEKYELSVIIKNSGNIELTNIEVKMDSFSDNISQFKYIGNLPRDVHVGDSLIIPGLKANEEHKLQFSLEYSDSFNSDLSSIISLGINDQAVGITNFDIETEIDTSQITSIQTNFTVVDSNQDELATNGELLTYTYTAVNDGKRSLSDITVKADIIDANLSGVIVDPKVYIDGNLQTLDFDSQTKEFKVDTLSAGQTLEITYQTTVTDLITYSRLQRIFNTTILNAMHISTQDLTINQGEMTRIKVDPTVLAINTSATVTDEDKNGLIAAEEKFTYSLKVENTGAGDLSNVSTRLTKTGDNVATELGYEVLSSSGDALVEGTDYIRSGDMIVVKELTNNDSFVINYFYKGASVIDLSGSSIFRSTTTNAYVDNFVTLTELYPDKDDRELDLSFTTSLDDGVDVTELGRGLDAQTIVTNTGKTVERNVKITFTDITDNIDLTLSNLEVTINDQVVTDPSVDLESKSIIIDEISPGDTVSLSYQFEILPNISPSVNPVELAITNVVVLEDDHEISAKSSALFATSTASDVTLQNVMRDSSDINTYVDRNEEITGVATITNVGYVIQEDLEITIETDGTNSGSFVIDSITSDSGEPLNSADYTINGNKVFVNQLGYQESINVAYSFKTNNTFDVNLSNFVLSTTVNLVTANPSNKTVTTNLKINPNISFINLNGQMIDENLKNLIEPNEKLSTIFTVENSGGLTQRNMPVKIESFAEQLTLDQLESFTITLKDTDGQTTILENGTDYTFDKSANLFTIFELNPGESLTFDAEYIANSTFVNSNQLFLTLSAKALEQTKKQKLVSIDMDYANMEHVKPSAEMEINQIDDNQIVTYSLDLLNDSEVEYIQLFADLSFDDAQVENLDNLEVTIMLNDQEFVPQSYELKDNILSLEFLDVHVGDDISIIISYKVNPQTTAFKSIIEADLYANGYNDTIESFVRLNPQTTTPEVDVEDPKIDGKKTASIAQGSEVTDQILLDLFDIESNQSSYSQLSIKYDIDSNVPGDYEVIFTLEDLISKQTTTFKTILTVTDTLPTITAKEIVTIDKTEVIDDYIDAFNVTASEITKGDLTNEVSVVTNAVFGKVGTYNVKFTVVDQDGNKTELISKLKIVNSLYPFLTGEDVYVSPTKLDLPLTNSEILKLINASARDYDGTDLTNQITITNDSGLTSPIQRSAITQSYIIEYQVMNKDGRITTETSTIFVSDDQVDVKFELNTNIEIEKSDDLTLEYILSQISPKAIVTINGESYTVNLTSDNILSTNLDLDNLGTYVIKFEYITNDPSLSVQIRSTVSAVVTLVEPSQDKGNNLVDDTNNNSSKPTDDEQMTLSNSGSSIVIYIITMFIILLVTIRIKYLKTNS